MSVQPPKIIEFLSLSPCLPGNGHFVRGSDDIDMMMVMQLCDVYQQSTPPALICQVCAGGNWMRRVFICQTLFPKQENSSFSSGHKVLATLQQLDDHEELLWSIFHWTGDSSES